MNTKKEIFVRDLSKPIKTKRDIAQRYFAIIADFTKNPLTEREIELLADITIKDGLDKNNFAVEFGTSLDTINNLISKLYKKRYLVKKDNIISINKRIFLDIKKDIFKLELCFRLEE